MPKELSLKQIEANRRNAQKSTGPRTSEGKAVVRRNAVTHGIFAYDLIDEVDSRDLSPERFHKLLEHFIQEYQPQGIMESILVERIAVCSWRLRRAYIAENEARRHASAAPTSMPKVKYIEIRMPNIDPSPVDPDIAALPREQLLDMIDCLRKNLDSAQSALHDSPSAAEPAMALPSREDVELILKYESTIEKQLFRALDQLERMQRHRRGDLVPPTHKRPPGNRKLKKAF